MGAEHHKTALLRARMDGVNPTEARKMFPDVFWQWRSGELRPFWLANALRRVPGGATALAATLGQHVSVIDGWGAGELYPGWDAVCTVAAAADLSVGELEIPVEQFVFPDTGDALADAGATLLASVYHVKVFEAAKPFRGNRLGVPATAAEADRVETARKEAATELLVAVFKRFGGQLSASAPDDPTEAMIWTQHEAEIRAFQQSLFNAAGDSTAQVQAHQHDALDQQHRAARERARTMPRLGPLEAINEPGTSFLFTADFTAEHLITGDTSSSNTVLTLSVSARRTETEDRIPVTASVRPWVRVLLGPTWGDRYLPIDTRSVQAANPLTTYFQVFIGPDGVAVDPPAAYRRN